MKKKFLLLLGLGICCSSCSSNPSGASTGRQINSISIGGQNMYSRAAKTVYLVGSYKISAYPSSYTEKDFYKDMGVNGNVYFYTSYQVKLDNTPSTHYDLPEVIDFTCTDPDTGETLEGGALTAISRTGVYYSYKTAQYKAGDKSAEVISKAFETEKAVDSYLVEGTSLYSVSFSVSDDKYIGHGSATFAYNSTTKQFYVNSSSTKYKPETTSSYYKGGDDDAFNVTFVE